MTDPLDPPLNSDSFQSHFVSSQLFSTQLRGSKPPLDTQVSEWYPTQTTTDNSSSVANFINIRGSWQEITDKHTRIWSLIQSGDSITGKGTHKSLYHTNTIALTGIINGYNVRINAHIAENDCTINYFLHLDDKQKFMRGEWTSNCNGEKGKIELSKSN